MKTTLLISSIVLTNILSLSAQTGNYFPNLLKVSVDTTYKAYFGYEKTSSRLINKPCQLSEYNNDPFFCSDTLLPEFKIIARYKNATLKDSVFILFDEGMSADPRFTIYTKSHKLLGSFPALEFYINSSGTIYTAGHTNNMYNRRRKFQMQNDKIVEIQQPYNYVGLKGKTEKNVTLYRDKVGTDIVAQIPKDYEIEILLAESPTKDFESDQLFLVRTDFGLVGWLRLSAEDVYETVLKGLFYAGD